MSSFYSGIKAIFIKDLVSELRSKETLPSMVVLGLLIVWVLRLVAEAGTVALEIMGPSALWIALLFAGLLAQERSFATEGQEDCISGLMLAPVDPGAIYIAKLIVNITLLVFFEIIIVPIVILAFQLSVEGSCMRLVSVLLLGNLGISGVGTLFSAMVQVSRIRGSLLSILVLAILLPLMMPATFGLLLCFGIIPEELFGTGAFAVVGDFSRAIGFLGAFDAVFITAGWLLFGFIVRD